MASKEIAKMLDEMMGAHRNSNPDDRDKERLTWWARGVCPFYLVDYCPHDLLTNTKGDLGACPKIHNDALKRDFADAPDTEPKKAEMMDDFLRFAQRLVGDLQSKIRRGKERATISQMERDAQNGISPQQQEEIEAKVTILTEKINELVTQAESAGTSGDIEEAQVQRSSLLTSCPAQGLLKLCDTLKGEREELKNQIGMKQHKLPPGFGGDGRHGENRQMEVCEVCGAFVNFWVGAGGENQSRVDDHLMGKQHIGYARLRATVESLGNEVQRLKDLLEEKEAENGKKESVFERNARLATTPRAIEAGKEETSEAKKSRSRSKESKSSSRRRSRSRSKGSRRSSDRRSKRDRSRSRDRRRGRDRSRDRKRSRSRDRKSSRERRRERSRERRRAGRSRSRSRS